MATKTLALDQLRKEAKIFRLPRIIAFNRLESRPRTLDFTRSLKAEVRDPLWMLTRQWQLGEFQGEDAGSPVTARISYRHHALDRVALSNDATIAFDAVTMPLEAYVEREAIPLILRERSDGTVYSDTIFALRWGRRFVRLLEDAGLIGHRQLYADRFPVRVLPPEPPPGGSREVTDHEAEQVRLAVGSRLPDGVAIWHSVLKGTHDPWLDSEPGGDKPVLKTLALKFAQGCSQSIERMFTAPPEGTSAWRSQNLEYAFATAGPPEPGLAGAEPRTPALVADQYPGGRLDWHSFDLADRSLPLEDDPEPAEVPDQVQSFLPGPVRFRGQPQPRFWQMEESQTDFGKIETSATGLLHLMLAEFGLIFSNDWFMLPHPMDMNRLCEIGGIVVDDSFGRHIFIRPAGQGKEADWQRFSLFHQSDRDGTSEANLFFLPPCVSKVLESAPLERVNFVRDEMANMAWAIETAVPSQMGMGMSGDESSRPAPPPAPIAPSADVLIGYRAGTRTPKNWIPFIPVHIDESLSEIRLQRARMAGGRAPRGVLLREPGSPYFVEEEEVPRAGIYVDRSWQRARWVQGRTVTWVGRRKSAGRGERSSGLAFDRIVDLKPKEE